MDIQITSLAAESHEQNTAAEVLKKAEDTKRRKYGDRIIQKENRTFIPIIFTTGRAPGGEARKVVAKLISKIAAQRKEARMEVALRIRTQLSFIFLKNKLMALRGSRRSKIAAENTGQL